MAQVGTAQVSGTIATIEGAPGAVVQAILHDLVERWQRDARVAGALATDHGLADRACSAGYLRNIPDGHLFPIFQDLGPGSASCHIDAAGAASASEAVRRDIAAGCDLVVLSKFGKLETAGSGLAPAFAAAIAAGVPLLTSVSRSCLEPWRRLAGPQAIALPPEPEQIDAWWRDMRQKAAPRV